MTYRPFTSLLIANRGEIACRIARTAKRMGLRTIAVYSEADAQARHVHMADEAHLLGAAPPRESYLNIERIVAAAKAAGPKPSIPATASSRRTRNSRDACEAAGLIFVGPPAFAIRAMGSKSAAKTLMEKAGVPLVPGYHGEAQDSATLRARGRHGSAFRCCSRRSPAAAARACAIVRPAGELGSRGSSAPSARPGRFRRRPDADRKIRRAPAPYRGADVRRQPWRDRLAVRARMHAAAPPSEGDRGSAVADARRRAARGAVRRPPRKAAAAVGYVGAGTVEFVASGKDAYLHRDEHPAAGRASGDGNDYRPRSGRMAVARGDRREAAACGKRRSRGAGMPSRPGSMPRTRRPVSCRRLAS